MRKAQALKTLILAAFLAIALPVEAQSTTKVKKTVVTTVETESDEAQTGEESEKAAEPSAVTGPERESTITAQFGSKTGTGTAGCKTEELSKNVIKELKADCNAWVKDQKTDLKSRFLTSSCQESCEDCPMSLKRCSVTGTVRYLLR